MKEVDISENTEFYLFQNLSVEDTEFDLSQNPSDPPRPDIKKSKFDFGFNTETKITEIIKDPMYLNLYSSFLPKLKKSFQNPTTEYKTFINTSWNLLNQHVPRQKEEDKSSINPDDFENFYLHTLRKLFEDNIIKWPVLDHVSSLRYSTVEEFKNASLVWIFPDDSIQP